MNAKLKKFFSTLRNVLGGFGLCSFLQDTLFIRDAALFIVDNIKRFISLIDYIAQAFHILLQAYRDVIYPVFDLLPFRIPTIWIDILFVLLVSDKASKLFFTKARKAWEREHDWILINFGIITNDEKRDFDKIDNLSAFLSLFGRFKNRNQAQTFNRYLSKVNDESELLLPIWIRGTLMVLDMFIASAIIIMFCIITANFDLYYRFYFAL